ncbi:MAG TPA: transglutaminase family protein [Herpetosiphonaceae bacterium]|nr:transglutaminase family protein [Herpetosiphonaceae bacterium]
MSCSSTFTPNSVEFLDHRDIEWPRVRRTRYRCYQRFQYCYPGPVRHLRQNLVVVPPDRYCDQRLCTFDLSVSPHPAAHRQVVDDFGNRVIALDVDWIDRTITFGITLMVERTANSVTQPTLPVGRFHELLRPTRLTTPDQRISAVAHELAGRTADPAELAARISDWVSETLTYGAGVTGVHTTAAEALAKGKGLCQDYAHVMLAICRVAGLPARYVSGHMLGEGGSHAWVEVLLPSERDGGLRPIAFDPTNRRRPNLGYTTVATGRDYCDVAPASGTYTGQYIGRLTFTKHAGLTLLEYDDGEVSRAEQ